MSEVTNQNGWNEYSKLVLKELESLSSSIDGLNEKIQDLKADITEVKAKEDRVTELREWKAKVDEVASPTQLKELIETVSDLKSFKIKAIGVFIAVQFIMGTAAWFMKFLE
jgi:uncharacterized coiled-coil DUF342 family protein